MRLFRRHGGVPQDVLGRSSGGEVSTLALQTATRARCASSRWARRVAAIALGCIAASAYADDTPLDRYLNGLSSLRANFSQTLVDSHEKVVDRSSGVLVVLRPGKFRWEVKPQDEQSGEAQLLIADGRNVWFFDRELEQVTVKPEDAALSATPAMLLSGAADVHSNFTVTRAGEREGLDWVLVEPRTAAADFHRALLGFNKGQLTRMIIDDKLGQTATVVFESIARNGPVAPEEVSFTPPSGVDVIGTAAK